MAPEHSLPDKADLSAERYEPVGKPFRDLIETFHLMEDVSAKTQGVLVAAKDVTEQKRSREGIEAE